LLEVTIGVGILPRVAGGLILKQSQPDTLCVARRHDTQIAAQEAYDQADVTARAAYLDALSVADAAYWAAAADAKVAIDAASSSYDSTLADLARQETELWDACAADPACSAPDPQALADIDAARTAAAEVLDAAVHAFTVTMATADRRGRRHTPG